MVLPEFDADRGCYGKERHETREEARDHKMGLIRKQRHGKYVRTRYGQRLDVYRCPLCHFWHVGHQQRRAKHEKKMRERKHRK